MFKFSSYTNSLLAENCLFCDTHLSHPKETLNKQPPLSICAPCASSLPWQTDNVCPQCGLSTTQAVCGQCLKNTPFYDSTHATLTYNYPIDTVLQQFKYQKKLNLTSTLAALLMQAQPDLAEVDYLVPMPMHPKRLQERGFNQSLEVAKVISNTLHIPIKQDACQRIIHTPPQAGLALKDRIKNIKGAFYSDADLSDLNVMVIDDVMTSGASLNELAKTLKKAGAHKVSNWVLARAL